MHQTMQVSVSSGMLCITWVQGSPELSKVGRGQYSGVMPLSCPLGCLAAQIVTLVVALSVPGSR